MSNYTLKSGQINFQNNDQPGAYSCVVIKDGKFHNLTDDLRKILIDLLQKEGDAPATSSLEDMF